MSENKTKQGTNKKSASDEPKSFGQQGQEHSDDKSWGKDQDKEWGQEWDQDWDQDWGKDEDDEHDNDEDWDWDSIKVPEWETKDGGSKGKKGRDDKLQGTDGDDVLVGTRKSDHIDGGAGNDTISGLEKNDHLYGGAGNDILHGDAGNDRLQGEDGDDELFGDAGNDKLEGGAGNDTLHGGSGRDKLEAGDGDDLLIWQAGDGRDKLDGGAGLDTFLLRTSDEQQQNVRLGLNRRGELTAEISGRHGAELVLENIERIKLEIGLGGATVSFGDLPAGVFGDEPLDLGGGAGNDVIDAGSSGQSVNIDAGDGDDTVNSGSGDDVITGGAGNDTVNAGAGNDTVVWNSGDGDDVIDGGEGDDQVALNLAPPSGSTAPVTLTVSKDADGNVILTGSDGSSLRLDQVEEVSITASDAGSQITIGDLTGTDISQNTLYFTGGSGQDFLDASATDRRIVAQGNGGDDTLLGGSGNDVLNGGDGDDLLNPGTGSGVDSVSGGAGNDQVQLTLGDEADSQAIDLVDGGTGVDTLHLTYVETSAHDHVLTVASKGDGSFRVSSADLDIDETVDVSNVEHLNLIASEPGLHFVLQSLADTSLAAGSVQFTGSAFTDNFDASATDLRVELSGNAGDDALLGGSQGDFLDGGDASDSLSGNGGDDWLVGGAGADLLNGGDGWDTASYQAAASGITVNLKFGTATDGSAATDTLIDIEAVEGSAHADTISGDDNANFLSGGDGADTIEGGGGFDNIRGGAGNDLLSDSDEGFLSGDAGNDELSGNVTYIHDPAAVFVDFVSYSATDGYGDTDQLLLDSAMVEGSNFDDQVIGADSGQSFLGRAGNDTLSGHAGEDVLAGGSGNDVLDGGADADTANYLDDGQDQAGAAVSGVLVNLATDSATDGWGGSDTLLNIENVSGSQLADDITGDAGDNRLIGFGGNDTLSGGAGNDFLIGLDGDDQISGGAGADIINGGRGDDSLSGGSGADTYFIPTGLDGALDFGHDRISDFDVAEDHINLSPFAEFAQLSDLDISEADGNTTIHFGPERSLTLEGVAAASLQESNFTFGGEPPPGTDGTAGNDTLEGTAGEDLLNGLEGDDILIGFEGDDTLNGGEGDDIANYQAAPAGIVADLVSGEVADGYGFQDTLIDIEDIQGSEFADVITGDAGDNIFWGYGGIDTINGGDGNDLIIGGPGVDQLDGGAGDRDAVYFTGDEVPFQGTGLTITFSNTDNTITSFNPNNGETEVVVNFEAVWGSVWGSDTITGNDADNEIAGVFGNDTLDGGAGVDLVSFSQPVHVDLASETAVYVNNFFGTAVIRNFENVAGSFGDDLLSGDSGDNILEGTNGNDTLRGGAGNDTLNGDYGQVVIGDFAVSGVDTADYSQDPSGVSVDLGNEQATDGYGDSDTLLNIENVLGSAFADVITGDAGDNLLNGLAGNDTLSGGAGADTYFLEDDAAGNATFGDDTVTDFDPAEDRISLQDFGELRDFSAVSPLLVEDNGDTLLNLAGGSLRLQGVTPAQLGADNFVFAQNQFLNGTENNDTLRGGYGDDLITGLGNNDVLYGEDGDDVIDGGAGFDNLYGGEGDDELEGGTEYDQLYGGAGSDLLTDPDQGDLYGEAGDDTLLATGSNHHNLYGGEGNDVLRKTGDAGMGGANIYGDVGDDELTVIDAWAELQGGAGNDVLLAINSGAHLYGGDGNDDLSGAPNYWNELRGGAGNDVLTDPDGTGFLFGGPGDDLLDGRVSYLEDPAGIYANLDGLAGDGQHWDVFGDGSVLVASRSAIDGWGDKDTLSAANQPFVDSNYSDYLRGSDQTSDGFELHGGDDMVFGLAGSDWFKPGSGSDTIDGGADWDNLNYWDDGRDVAGAFQQGVVVNLSSVAVEYQPGQIAPANQASDPWGNVDYIYNIEAVNATDFDDVLIGTDEHNWLNGAGGNDSIYGGDQSGDNLIGGPGDDLLDGQGGDSDQAWYNEWLYDENFNQILSGPGITVNLATNSATDQYGGQDQLLSIEHVEGSPYDDSITGDALNNSLQGRQGNDTIHGGAGADQLRGDEGDDQLYGGADDDWFVGGPGNDLVDGGSGSDQLNYDGWSGTTSGISLDLANPLTTGPNTGYSETPDGQGGTDHVAGVERVSATDHADFVAGDAADNWFWGRAGNDTLQGGAGNDWLDGGDDFDQLEGGAGNDQLNGGENDDILSGGSGQDVFRFSRFTEQGNPTSFGQDLITDFSITDDTLDLNQVPEFTNLAAVQSRVISAPGEDLVISFDSDNGFGPETSSITLQGILTEQLSQLNIWFSPFTGTEGDDVLNGNEGNDNIYGLGGNDQIYGNGGHDNLHGDAGNDTIAGGAGGDNLDGGAGNDVLDGGADQDWLDYRWNGQFTGVYVDLAGGTASDGLGGTDTLSNIENVQGSEFADTLIGDSENNQLQGLEGADSLSGGAGQDRLEGGPGNDSLAGGAGSDTFTFRQEHFGQPADFGHDSIADYENSDWIDLYTTGVYNENFLTLFENGQGDLVLEVDANNSITLQGLTLADFPSLNIGYAPILGTDGDDTLVGTADNDSIEGRAGNDLLQGLAGADNLRGGSGNDTLQGGAGSDNLEPGSGNDVLDGGDGWDNANYFTEDYDSGAIQPFQGIVLNLSDEDVAYSYAQGSGSALAERVIDTTGFTDEIYFVESISGSVFNDVLIGDNRAHSYLNGQDGDDLLISRWADGDNLHGGAGNDVLDGTIGAFDNAQYNTGQETSGVSVNLFTGSATDGQGGVDTLIAVENVNGSIFADNIVGDDVSNFLQGNGGNDTLIGFAGADNLYGNDGDDTLEPGFGDDWMSGGAGDDTFVFSDGDAGAWDHIQDFVAGGSEDRIDLSGVAALTDFATVQAAALDDGSGNVNIDLGDGNTLHLVGVSAASLEAVDFLF